ncbi:hypothetical protein KKE06_04940 [Candidatus Micrarchaeota archaeon]|nr:hypothetical protein [Candidatus Micrarchaeota archaeon]
MPSKTVRKRQLARKIAQAMGTSNKRPLVEASHPMIQARFHPHSHQGPKKGYPLYHIEHELSKLPRENVASFVNIPAVIGQLQRLPPITRLLKRYPSLARGFEKTVWEAIRERGIKGSKFWATAPKAYIDTIAKAGKGNPNLMNDRVGRITKRFFGNQIKPRTILDIGTFAGGTIVGAVKGLSPEQRKQLKVVLVDINERVVREHAVPQLVGLGIPKRNILVLPASFYSAAVAFKQMRRPFH